MHGHEHREWRLRLGDMVEALRRIEGYLQGMTLGTFLADPRTVDAVVRNLEILGEASRHVPTGVRQKHAGVPWDKLHEMRNYLAHEYFGVDDKMIWETATRDLRGLRQSVERLAGDRG